MMCGIDWEKEKPRVCREALRSLKEQADYAERFFWSS
jgi:hypothetical protein